jgi:peroxiredoxin
VRTWIALLIVGLSGCGGASPATPAPRAGAAGAPRVLAPATALPAVPLTDLDDKPTLLGAAAGGKPALVTFWATWCDACVAELDALKNLDAHAKQGGGVVIGVAVGESREKAAAFAKQHALTYAQLVDEKLAFADALGQKRLPATLVLDRKGRVIFTGGALDAHALDAFRMAMAR